MEEYIKKIEELNSNIKTEINNVTSLNDLNDLKIKYLSKKGEISSLTSIMGSLDIEQKKEFGKILNELKDSANTLIENKKNELEEVLLNQKLEQEKIDISLPATEINIGAPNIL